MGPFQPGELEAVQDAAVEAQLLVIALTTAAEQRPLAVVVPERVYQINMAFFHDLCRDVQAELVLLPARDLSVARLSAQLRDVVDRIDRE